jgi:hypothetical protein
MLQAAFDSMLTTHGSDNCHNKYCESADCTLDSLLELPNPIVLLHLEDLQYQLSNSCSAERMNMFSVEWICGDRCPLFQHSPSRRAKSHLTIRSDIVAPSKIACDPSRVGNPRMPNEREESCDRMQRRPNDTEGKVHFVVACVGHAFAVTTNFDCHSEMIDLLLR